MILSLWDQLIELPVGAVDAGDPLTLRVDADGLHGDVVVRVVRDLDEVLHPPADLAVEHPVVESRAHLDVLPRTAGKDALVDDVRRRRTRGEKKQQQREGWFHNVQKHRLEEGRHGCVGDDATPVGVLNRR
ncbi:MAG: hypothetical protein ACXW5U_15325 [Thermoanaerobaculia bacterium]